MPRKIFLHENLNYTTKPKGNYVELNSYLENAFDKEWISEQVIPLPKVRFIAYGVDQTLERLISPIGFTGSYPQYGCIKSWKARALAGDEDGTAHVCLKVGDNVYEDIIVTKN